MKSLGDDEIELLVAEFRAKLFELNEMQKQLLELHLAGDFYIGPNKTYTYLPDAVIFKRTTVERF